MGVPTTSMGSSSSSSTSSLRSSTILIASSASIAVLATTWRIILWRARTRAKATVERVRAYLKEDSPLIDTENVKLRKKIMDTALRRASKWIKLSQEATPMVEQVGGRRLKKPVLTMSTEYVLKPLATDHRGIREIAFYEAVEIAQKSSSQQYAQFLSGEKASDVENSSSSSSSSRKGKKRSLSVVIKKPVEVLDTIALALAMLVKDPEVRQSEDDLKRAWRAVKHEVEAMNYLNKFVPRYFGVVMPNEGGRIQSIGTINRKSGAALLASLSSATEATTQERMLLKQESAEIPLDDAYLLLSRLSQRFVRPCIMDVKMGTCTYEPNATDAKKEREIAKYPKQEQFGFRITGMRVYDPFNPESDQNGCRLFDKEYGRALESRESLLDALRLFFSCSLPSISEEGGENENASFDGQQLEHQRQLRRRVVSNVLLEVRSLRKWFEDVNRALEFKASSLLIIYDADQQSNGDVAMVRMIDFGRVRRKAGGDPGYRMGLRTLKHLLTDLLEEADAAEASPSIQPPPLVDAGGGEGVATVETTS